MLIVIGTAHVDPARREQFIEATTAVTIGTRSDDGCQSYGFYADLTDPATVVGVEIWRDRTALDEHMNHAHTHEFLATVPDLIVGEPDMTIHDVL